MCCTAGLNWKWEGKELDQLSIDLLQAWKPRVKGDFASLDFENWMEVLHRLGSWECLAKLKCGKDEQNSTNARLRWQNCYRLLLLLEFYNMPYYLFIFKKTKTYLCIELLQKMTYPPIHTCPMPRICIYDA